MQKLLEPLLSLAPSKHLFRVTTVVLIGIFLASQFFPWAERILGRLISFPELRHEIKIDFAASSVHLSENEMSLELLELLYGNYRVINPYSCFRIIQRKPFLAKLTCLQDDHEKRPDIASLTVANEGFGVAENVLIHVRVKGSEIADFKMDSEELYEIKSADFDSGEFNIWLDRISSQAQVKLGLVGTGFLTNTIALSATSDQGSSISTIEAPTFLRQVESYTNNIVGLFGEATEIIWYSEPIRNVRKQIYINKQLERPLQIVTSQPFRKVVLAISIIIFLIVIFLPDFFQLFIPILVGLVAWVFSNSLIFGVLTSIFTLFFIFIWQILRSEFSNNTTSSQSSVVRKTPTNVNSDTRVLTQYERHISELKHALIMRENENQSLTESLHMLIDYLKKTR